ncbi:MAG: hypothetical protein ACM3NT_05175 [Methylocystaceae bacterium]
MEYNQQIQTFTTGSQLRLKVRFDYRGTAKRGRVLKTGLSEIQAAEAVREQKANYLRNVPIQGIHIEDIDMSLEVYNVFDDLANEKAGFAPLTIVVTADSIEDALRFVMKEEFRKVEVLEPAEFHLSKLDIERLLFSVNDEIKSYRMYLQRKMDNY